MRITWYGHACFRIEGGGVAVVTDPYTPERSGLLAVSDPADAVVMSSALDEAHSNGTMIPGTSRILNALEAVARPVTLVDGVTVEGVAAMEGSDRPDDPKANALYRFELEGIAVGHMGDVGNPLTEEQLAPLRGRVDVLLALAGGGQTIALSDLETAIAEIAPRVVIPMHYDTPALLYDCGPVEDFLERYPDTPVVHHEGSTIDLDSRSLPDELTIHVLQPLKDPTSGGGV
jgi:L-ascorbate metabolism protein UlaG (beta-lactamase superfamily)